MSNGSLLSYGHEFIGGITGAYSVKTGNTTLTTSDHLIKYTSGSYTVTLPTAVGDPGREFIRLIQMVPLKIFFPL